MKFKHIKLIDIVYLIVVGLLLIGCVEQAPEPFELNGEDIQNASIHSYMLKPHRESKQATLYVETCDSLDTVNQPTIYEFEAKAGKTYDVNFHITTMSCAHISLDAKLYIFDAKNRMIANGKTNEMSAAGLKFIAYESEPHYFVVIPMFREDIGGYSALITPAN